MVRAMAEQSSPAGRIVVGVDGSASSKTALRWAVEQAGRTGARVQVIIAWHYPAMVGGYAWAPVSVMEAANFAEVAEKTAAETIAEVVDPASTVSIETCVREGNAAGLLIEAAEGAELLVVGSRGHGGFTSALLGSVSLHCAQHSPCPIVIVRGHAAS
jgi:nucleotide-binding universal stress UspA family protein